MRNREHFDAELAMLQSQLNSLGAMAEGAVACALDSLAAGDAEGCRTLVADDRKIDQAQQRLEAHAVNLIALQQPVARDLRRILTAIAIGGELERIADYAKGVAKYVVRAGEAPLQPPAELVELGQAARDVLRLALASVESGDAGAARETAAADDAADRLYRSARAALVRQLAADPGSAEQIADLLFIAHNLERIGDRATNVGERVVYLVSGAVVELNP
jgi:phosphate transport system protein